MWQAALPEVIEDGLQRYFPSVFFLHTEKLFGIIPPKQITVDVTTAYMSYM
jgi:hypothetical protein